jgi:hypothetical protein
MISPRGGVSGHFTYCTGDWPQYRPARCTYAPTSDPSSIPRPGGLYHSSSTWWSRCLTSTMKTHLEENGKFLLHTLALISRYFSNRNILSASRRRELFLRSKWECTGITGKFACRFCLVLTSRKLHQSGNCILGCVTYLLHGAESFLRS